MQPTWIREEVSLWLADCFAVFPAIKPQSVDLILADLPYGTTACPWDSVLPLDKLWQEYARIKKPNTAILLTAAQPFAWRLCASKPEWFKYDIIWEKPNGTNPLLIKQQPFRSHESILVFYERQPIYHPQMTYGHACSKAFADASKTIGQVYNGVRTQRNRLISRHRANTDGSRYPRSVQRFEQERTGHPTKKPVDLMRWLIRSYSNPGDVVLDNTMGEGTTGIACLHEERRFLGIEQDEGYYTTAMQQMAETLSTRPMLARIRPC